MGAYLHIGFVATATAELPENITKAKFQKEIVGYYPRKIFDYSEVKDGEITLTLKQSVLKAELEGFVKAIYADYHDSESAPQTKAALKFIEKHLDHPDWLEKAREAGLYYFSIQDYGISETFKIDGQEIWLQMTVVTLGSEGKFSMEDSEKTLLFMETCAQKAYSNFLLAPAFRVYVL